MTRVWQFAPASWRAFFVLALTFAGAASSLWGQRGYRPPPGYVQIGKPDQEEGRRILQEFRELGLPTNYFFEFQLRVLPRRGPERTIPGRIWTGRNHQGTISRVSFTSPGGSEQRLLIQNGPQPAVWSWQAGAGQEVQMLGIAAWFTPIADTNLTAFDLQMPFLYWSDFVFEGVARVGGRPAHQFLLYPPADFAAKYPALTGVRIYLDTQFRALVQSQQIGDEGKLLKTFSLLELKKLGNETIPKTFDVRDEATRDKTRLIVTGAALEQNHAPELFTPGTLPKEMASPPATAIVPIAP